MTRSCLLAACVAGAAGAGCEPETRVIAVRGGFHHLPGAEGGIQPEGGRSARRAAGWETVLRVYDTEAPAGEDRDQDPLRHVAADGTVTLICRSPAHLVHHLRDTLRRGEVELVYEQLLAQQLKDNYIDRGRDPRDALTWILKKRRSIEKLLASMPAGERTPGATMKPIGRNAFRISPPGVELLELRYTSIDVTIEDGSFRLLMIR